MPCFKVLRPGHPTLSQGCDLNAAAGQRMGSDHSIQALAKAPASDLGKRTSVVHRMHEHLFHVLCPSPLELDNF